MSVSDTGMSSEDADPCDLQLAATAGAAVGLSGGRGCERGAWWAGSSGSRSGSRGSRCATCVKDNLLVDVEVRRWLLTLHPWVAYMSEACQTGCLTSALAQPAAPFFVSLVDELPKGSNLRRCNVCHLAGQKQKPGSLALPGRRRRGQPRRPQTTCLHIINTQLLQQYRCTCLHASAHMALS